MIIPKILTIIYVMAGLLFTVLLLVAAWRHRNPPAPVTVPDDVKEHSSAATNRWLRGLRIVLAVLVLTVLGFHSYFVFRADTDENFMKAKRSDARNRRLAESALKGWVLDRSGKLENALIRYRSDGGTITREYPLGAAAVHLTGYADFISGSGGMEYAYRSWLMDPVSILNQLQSPTPVGKDLQVSIDIGLQREAYNLLRSTGKPGAALVLLLPNNEVLAMASYPSFEPTVLNNGQEWQRLNDEVEAALPISPLVNRALGTLVTGGAAFWYRPGSTFKIFIAAVAIDSAMTQERFTCQPGGFQVPGFGHKINDYDGHVHGTIGLDEAFQKSCNQYFMQLGLKLGRERLANYARRLHFAVSPDDKTRRATDLWFQEHGATEDFNYIFAPPVQRLNLSAKGDDFDLAQQSIGQGSADLTVMKMAVIAASAASSDGAYVAPTFEVGRPRKVVGEFIKPKTASELRRLMKLVTQAPGGTAVGVFRTVTAGGKTGTADREVIDYKTPPPANAPVDEDGRPRRRRIGVTDSWFIGFAPADNPQIAFAVMIEDGGTGASAAAPICARLAERAASSGLIKSPGADPTPSSKSARPAVRKPAGR